MLELVESFVRPDGDSHDESVKRRQATRAAVARAASESNHTATPSPSQPPTHDDDSS